MTAVPGPQFRVLGRALLAEVLIAYQPYRPLIERSPGAGAVIVRFSAGPGAAEAWTLRMRAAQVSAQQKQRVFARLGVPTMVHVLPDTAHPAQLQELIAAANTDPRVSALIVQTPAPRRLVPLLDEIAVAKDVDALGVHAAGRVCATADGITRVATPFLAAATTAAAPTTAVVGGRGFVGSGVVELLRRAGHSPLVLDAGDDLAGVRDVDVVIATTGQPGLLTPEHLHRGHRLVVDAGFVPYPSGAVGDVRPDAQHLPAAITPVPGGIGPVEMAVLAERLVTVLVAPDLQPWAFHAAGEETRRTTAAATVTAQQAAVLGTRSPPRPSLRPPGPVRRPPEAGPDQSRRRR